MLPQIIDPQIIMRMSPRDFGERFINSKYGRPYRRKNRKARTNFRSGNKKKMI